MTGSALLPSDGQELLRIAWSALREHIESGSFPPGKPHRAALVAPGGAMIELHVDGALHACACDVDSTLPLYLTIERLAAMAAEGASARDPLRAEELRQTRLVLATFGAPTPLALADADGLADDEGVMVTRGARRGAVLPHQRGELRGRAIVERAAKKAGLSSLDGTAVQRFTATYWRGAGDAG